MSELNNSTETILETRGLCHHFDGVKAIRDLSFKVTRGEVVGIIGPNGSGKTTLFNLVSQVYPVRNGEVLLNGISTTGLQPEQLVDRGLVRTFQSPRVFPSMSVAGNIITALAAREQKGKPHNYLLNLLRPAKTLEKKAFEILDLIGLSPLASRQAGSLPYGLKRILDIGRCLGGSPELILLDEPAAGLNDDERHHLFELLQKLRKDRELSMMVIEHDVEFVKNMCQRMIVLSEGQLIAAGDPASVLADVCVRTAYLGEEVYPC